MSDDDHLLIGRALGQTWRRANVTEAYVSIPPALIIMDSDGAVWTAGRQVSPDEFIVLRNDLHVGETAQFVEYNNGLVRLFGRTGWRSFSRNRRHFI